MIQEFLITIFKENILLMAGFLPFFRQLGLIWGSSFFLLLVGSLTKSPISLLFLAIIITATATAGDLLGYWIGKKFYKTEFFQKILNKKKNKKIYLKSKRKFKKYGFMTILFSRFLIFGFGPPLNYIAGIESYNRKKFICAVIIGEAIYALELLYIGYFFKETFYGLDTFIMNLGLILLAIFILFKVIGKLRKKK
jgi:membrane protein DedA with SNARE-associated domain